MVTGMMGRSKKRQAMPATTACGKNITGGYTDMVELISMLS